MKLLFLPLLITGYVGRLYLRGNRILLWVDEVNCTSANSMDCVEKCASSNYCTHNDGALGDDIFIWRKCLLDLGEKCTFTFKGYIGNTVNRDSAITEVQKDGKIGYQIDINNMNFYDLSEENMFAYKWALDNDYADQCLNVTYYTGWTPSKDLSETITNTRDLTATNAKLSKSKKGQSYLILKNINGTSISDPRLNLLVDENFKNCLFNKTQLPYQGRSWGIKNSNGEMMHGAKKAPKLLPLDLRQENLIGTTPLFEYDS